MSKATKKGFIKAKINGIDINSSLKCHSSNYENLGNRTIKYIVVHYTGNSKDTAKANANYFKGRNRRASAHFFVDNDSIYQSVELRDKAWHCGGYQYFHKECRNTNSIGIEMCCTAGNYKISDKTIKNTAYLCAYLCKEFNISADNVDKYVLRHYDITHKKCPAQMVDNPSEWKDFKAQIKKILRDSSSFEPYLIKVTTDLNIRDGAGTSHKVVGMIQEKYKGVYTIVAEKAVGSSLWGKLKSGAGWINLKYTKKV